MFWSIFRGGTISRRHRILINNYYIPKHDQTLIQVIKNIISKNEGNVGMANISSIQRMQTR